MYTILFVDDNKNIRQFCQRELEQEGYRVLIGADGKGALDALQKYLPDLVVLDLRMPGMNGLEVITRMMKEHRDVPVIFYTAHKEDLHFDFRGWHAEACVEKSEDLAELKAAIARVLAQGG